MKKNGTQKERYWAIARHSGKPAPYDTELVGRYRHRRTAEGELPLYGGYVVQVTNTQTWRLKE